MAKTKQKKTSKAMVVYSQPPPNQQKKNKNKKKKSTSLGNNDLQQYRAALQSPFSPLANGARVPDMYCVPTATRHITKVLSIKANVGGDFDIVVLPSAYVHAISSRGNLISGTPWVVPNGDTVNFGIVKTSPTSLENQLVNYRIVGYGVKLMGVESLLSAGGRVCAATVPISSWVSEKSATVGGLSTDTNMTLGTVANALRAYGLPTDGTGAVDMATLPSLPNSVELPAVRLSDTPLFINSKVSSPEAFDFKQSSDRSSGYDIVNHTTTSGYVTSGDASYLRLGGFEAIAITGSGLTPNATVMDVEIIYHLEGTPFISGSAIVGSDSHTANTVNPIGWMNVIQSVARQPNFRDMVEVGGNTLLPGLGSLAARFM